MKKVPELHYKKLEIPIALTAIQIAELTKKAGSKRKVAQLAGIQNLGSLSHESVLIGDRMYRPSISTADWGKVNKELVGEA